MEEFKKIKGFEGKYLVSNLGRVKSICAKEERFLKQYKGRSGYMFVCLSRGKQEEGGRYKYKDIHRLVAEAFIPNPKKFGYVNHKDENKLNNNVENLEWCTAKYNSNYGNIKEKMCKKVGMYNKELELLKTFMSVCEAANHVNGSKGNISSCCKGRLKTAYGYVWKYIF